MKSNMLYLPGNNDGTLREKRLELRLTQQQVADRAGIMLQQYQKFESGHRNIRSASFYIACKVLEALEINITHFFRNMITEACDEI